MVSGFVTSPLDQERICLEDARPISIASKLLMSITGFPLLLVGDLADGDVLVDVLGVRRGGVVGHALVALLDLGLLGLVSRLAVGGAHAGEVDAELLGRAQQV